MYKFVYSNEES